MPELRAMFPLEAIRHPHAPTREKTFQACPEQWRRHRVYICNRKAAVERSKSMQMDDQQFGDPAYTSAARAWNHTKARRVPTPHST